MQIHPLRTVLCPGTLLSGSHVQGDVGQGRTALRVDLDDGLPETLTGQRTGTER
ncbi:hypothetical protein D3C75_571430 [compost metagenome]